MSTDGDGTGVTFSNDISTFLFFLFVFPCLFLCVVFIFVYFLYLYYNGVNSVSWWRVQGTGRFILISFKFDEKHNGTVKLE